MSQARRSNKKNEKFDRVHCNKSHISHPSRCTPFNPMHIKMYKHIKSLLRNLIILQKCISHLLQKKRSDFYVSKCTCLTHQCFRDSPEIVVWINDTFDNNFGFQYYFTKYLKESCWHDSKYQSCLKYFSMVAFPFKIPS